MATLSSLSQHEPQRVLVYGPSKSGKTRAVAGLAEKFKLKVIDAEFGWSVARQIPAEYHSNIDLIQIADNATTPEAAYAVLALLQGKKFSVCQKHNKFCCALCKDGVDTWTLADLRQPNTILVLDSMTQLTNSIINSIVKSKSPNGDMSYQMQIQDWGKGNLLMDMILSYIQSLKINVVCISHEKDVSPMESKVERLAPVIMTKEFSRTAPKFFDSAVWSEFSNLKYRLSTLQASKTAATIGSRQVNDVDKTGSLLSLFNYIEQS